MTLRKAVCRLGHIAQTMFEVVVENRSQNRWEWRVCDRAGETLMAGWEESRNAARYRGERALFQLLLVRVPKMRPPE